MPAITTTALTKVYQSRLTRKSVRALDTLDLTVGRGEIFGLLGPNGAGKTTLLKVLLGIVRPTSGTAMLMGLPVHRTEARRRIGFLPENHRFPPFLTAAQLLDLYGRLGEVADADRKARIPALLDLVRLGAWRDTRIRQYSKGMMQRLGIAQALLNEPDIVFLDEPTDGVDPIGRKEIRDMLLQLQQRGTTVFLNSHLLSEIEHVCTRVAILHQGRLVREGSIAALTAVDRIYELTASPIPEALARTLGDHLFPKQPGPDDLHTYELRVQDRAHLNQILDQLRAAGVALEAVHPVRRSLEDYFIDVITHA